MGVDVVTRPQDPYGQVVVLLDGAGDRRDLLAGPLNSRPFGARWFPGAVAGSDCRQGQGPSARVVEAFGLLGALNGSPATRNRPGGWATLR